MRIYVPSVKITFLLVGPWKFDVALEKYLKTGCNFLYEPWWMKQNSHKSIERIKHSCGAVS